MMACQRRQQQPPGGHVPQPDSQVILGRGGQCPAVGVPGERLHAAGVGELPEQGLTVLQAEDAHDLPARNG